MVIYNIGVRSVRTEQNRGGNTSFETSFEILRHWKADVGVAIRGRESVRGVLHTESSKRPSAASPARGTSNLRRVYQNHVDSFAAPPHSLRRISG